MSLVGGTGVKIGVELIRLLLSCPSCSGIFTRSIGSTPDSKVFLFTFRNINRYSLDLSPKLERMGSGHSLYVMHKGYEGTGKESRFQTNNDRS